MKRKSSWVSGVGALASLMLLAGSGCVDAPRNLSGGGSGGSTGGGPGKAGSGGRTAAGGSSGGTGMADAGVGPIDEGGGGSVVGAGGVGNEAGVGGEGGGGEQAGEPGTCQSGLTLCAGSSECVDLKGGTPAGDSVDDCGTCGTTCSLAHAESAACNKGACEPSCEAGFDDCNAATANDGCEADLTSPTSCGACGAKCSLSGTTGQACVSGHCAPTCAALYADCNSNAPPAEDDGCELYLDSLNQCTTGCGSASVACGPTKVCNGGSCVAPAGVAILSTPLTDSAQAQRFADVFGGVDLEGSSVTVRAYAPGATGGTLAIYLSDSASGISPTVLITDLSSLSQKWMDLTVQATTLSPFNAANVRQVNIEVRGGTDSMTNPTLVYVDSVRSSNLLVNDTFDATFGNLVKSSLVVVTGSSIDWAAALP